MRVKIEPLEYASSFDRIEITVPDTVLYSEICIQGGRPSVNNNRYLGTPDKTLSSVGLG